MTTQKQSTPYRVLKKLSDSKAVALFEETLKDGTKTDFSAQVSVKRTGGGVQRSDRVRGNYGPPGSSNRN